MASPAPLVLGSWADCHWRGATVQDLETVCPRCGAPATLQEPMTSWTEATGWVYRREVRCRGQVKREVPTPRRGGNRYGFGQTMTVRGCGLVTIETRSVEGLPPAVVEQVKEETIMPRGTLTPHAVREELFRRVRAGEHPTEVGKELGLQESTASDLVRRAGIEYAHRDPISAMREARRPGKKACQRLPPDLVTEGVRLCLEEGVSVVEAGKRVGVNFRSLKHYITKARRERAAASAPPPAAPALPTETPPTAPEVVIDVVRDDSCICLRCGGWLEVPSDAYCIACASLVARERAATAESAREAPVPTCRDCGAPIKSGNLLCWDCSAIPEVEDHFADVNNIVSAQTPVSLPDPLEQDVEEAPHSLDLSSLARHIEILASVMGGEVPVATRLSAAADQLGRITFRKARKLDRRLIEAIETIVSFVDDVQEQSA